jgi:hypothetical protein
LKNSKAFPVLACAAAIVFSAAPLRALGGREVRGEEAPRYFRDRNGPAPPGEHGGDTNRVSETVRVTGRVRLVGSGPHTELVITGAAEEWHTEAQDRDKLIDLQQRTVTLEGRLDSRNLILPDGTYAGQRLILRNITVLHAE